MINLQTIRPYDYFTVAATLNVVFGASTISISSIVENTFNKTPVISASTCIDGKESIFTLSNYLDFYGPYDGVEFVISGIVRTDAANNTGTFGKASLFLSNPSQIKVTLLDLANVAVNLRVYSITDGTYNFKLTVKRYTTTFQYAAYVLNTYTGVQVTVDNWNNLIY